MAKRLSNEQELQLVEDYRKGASVISLMEKYGYASKKSITDKVKKHYPNEYNQIIEEAKANRKEYNYALSEIKNEFDAYFIGLMLTDGYISQERKVGIDLCDEDCVAFLSKTIGTHYSSYDPDLEKEIQGTQKIHRMILSDRALVQDLERFGVVEHKTYTLQGPKLNKEEEKFIPYIIRGIIDGDGCVFSTSYGAPAFYIITKSEDFKDWVEDVLTNKLFMKDIRVTYTKEGLYRIETALQDNILKLISLVYDKPFGMRRKYEKIRKMFRDYNSDLLIYK